MGLNIKEIGNNLREERGRLPDKITQEEAARLAGVSTRAWQEYERGNVPVPLEVLMRYAQARGVTFTSLIGVHDDLKPENVLLADEVAVPLVDEVRAGGPSVFLDPLSSEVVVTRKFKEPALFALRVKGDSMYPEFQDGDIAVCADRVEDVVSGYIYVVVQREDGATLKRVFRRGGKYNLMPSNEEHPMITLYREQIDSFYPVLELQRVLRPLLSHPS